MGLVSTRTSLIILIILEFLVFAQAVPDPTLAGSFNVIRPPHPGGCDDEKFKRLSRAFDEAYTMSKLIREAVTYMRNGQESPAIGYLVHYLFSPRPSELLLLDGLRRPAADIKILDSISELMRALQTHSTRNMVYPTLATPKQLRSTRIFCDGTWLVDTATIINPITEELFTHDPKEWWDEVSQLHTQAPGGATHLPPGLPTLLDPICYKGKEGSNAVSIPGDMNAITFCPNAFTDLHTDPVSPKTTTIASLILADYPKPGNTPPDTFRDFNSLSATFLHEYTHMVGKGQGIVPSVTHVPEAYGYDLAVALCNENPALALKNADSYALFGMSLIMNLWDWRDGTCREHAFWAAPP